MRRTLNNVMCSGAALIILVLLPGCAAKDHPAGVSRFVSYTVNPVFPKSYEITASAQLSAWGHYEVAELKDAWEKKAVEVAKGRKFKGSSLVVHTSETDEGGGIIKSRSVSGIITLTE